MGHNDFLLWCMRVLPIPQPFQRGICHFDVGIVFFVILTVKIPLVDIGNVAWGYRFKYCQWIHFHNKEVHFWMKVMQYQHSSKYDENICFVGVRNE